MKELGQFQQSLIRTGQALPSGVVPPISSTLKYDQASDPVYQAMSARVNAPQTPLTPPVSEPNAYTKYFADPVRSAATTGANAMGAVGNAFTSSEQKLGGIIGDAAASAGSVRVGGTGNFNVGIPGTGGQSISDQAAQNDANTQQMISRVQHQITLDKSQGKDTSHLEQVLTMALGNKKSAEQQIAEQAPGSLATNEEATGALGGVALDLATAGTAGPVGKPIEGAVKTFDVGAKGFGQIVKKGAKEGLKVAPVTAAYGATQAMQDNGSVGDIAGSAAISGAGGFLVPADRKSVV